CAIDPLMRQEHAAFQAKFSAAHAQRLAQFAEVRQCGELIECGDLKGHGGCLSGTPTRGNPAEGVVIPAFAGDEAASYALPPLPSLAGICHVTRLFRTARANAARTTTSEQSRNEEFPFRRPVDGPRSERHGGDVASAGGADRCRRAAGRWHGCG